MIRNHKILRKLIFFSKAIPGPAHLARPHFKKNLGFFCKFWLHNTHIHVYSMYFILYFNYKNRVYMCEASSKQYPNPKISRKFTKSGPRFKRLKFMDPPLVVFCSTIPIPACSNWFFYEENFRFLHIQTILGFYIFRQF